MDYVKLSNRILVSHHFDKKYDQKEGCWNWKGMVFKNRGGYGCFTCRPLGIKTARAHRVAYQLANRVNILENVHVLHSCDNPRCVNPDHLFLGDQPSNMEDRQTKNRQNKGDDHGMHKLKEPQVLEIRSRLKNKEKGRTLAKEFGVTEITISDIKRRRSWRHLPT